MRVTVTVKKGKKFNRTENGQLVTYVHGAKFTVSEHVFRNFRDAFVPLGDEPPAPAPRVESQTPGTDDEPPLVTQLVTALASVGLVVDPAKAAGWTEQEIERIPGLIGRKGKNPPKFVTAALVEPPQA